MVISCSTWQKVEEECTWVKYLIYNVWSQFQICRKLRRIGIPKISEFTKKCFFPSLIKACIPFLSTKQPPQLFPPVKPSTDLESLREATATYFGFYLVLVIRTRKKPARSSACLQTAPSLYSLQYERFQLKWPTGYSWKLPLHGDLGVQFQWPTIFPFYDLPIHLPRALTPKNPFLEISASISPRWFHSSKKNWN